MQLIKHIPVTFLSAALAYLAYSLIQVAEEVAETRNHLPALLEKVHVIEKDIEIESWLELVVQINQQLPVMVEQIEKVRQTADQMNSNIPPILQEIQAVRSETLPSILAEVKTLRQQTVPSVLNEVKVLRTQTIPPVLSEVKAVRTETVPPVLQEVAAVREMVPGTLDRLERLTDKSQSIVENAAGDAVHGTAKGVITTPFNLIESLVGGDDEKKSDN